MKRWNWALAWLVLRGRVISITHTLDYHQNTVLVALRTQDGMSIYNKETR